MHEENIEKLMHRLLLENNEILDQKPNQVSEKPNTVEAKIRTKIYQIEEDISSLKCSNQVEFNKMNQTVGSIEDSQYLIFLKFEKDKKKIHFESTSFHQELSNMKSVVRDNDIETNRLAQHNRFSFILEISGIRSTKMKVSQI